MLGDYPDGGSPVRGGAYVDYRYWTVGADMLVASVALVAVADPTYAWIGVLGAGLALGVLAAVRMAVGR